MTSDRQLLDCGVRGDWAKRAKRSALLVLAALAWSAPGLADTTGDQEDMAARLFSQKCSGCHTVGHGSLVGPDLKEVVSWKSSELESNVKRMEKLVGPLSDDEVKALVTFLKDSKVQQRISAEAERAVAAQAAAEPASSDVGCQLFLGSQRFNNGGPSCISCHQVEGHGGTMGKDLTEAYSKMGESALISTCEQPNFPVMKAIYRDHPIGKQEALHLTKYLASLKDSRSIRPDPPVAEMGFVGAAICLGGILFFYRNRNKGARARLNRR